MLNLNRLINAYKKHGHLHVHCDFLTYSFGKAYPSTFLMVMAQNNIIIRVLADTAHHPPPYPPAALSIRHAARQIPWECQPPSRPD